MQILPGANINLAGGISLEGALRGQRGVHELVNAVFFFWHTDCSAGRRLNEGDAAARTGFCREVPEHMLGRKYLWTCKNSSLQGTLRADEEVRVKGAKNEANVKAI